MHRNEEYAALKGHLVHSDPWATPLLLHRSRWVLLTPAGGYRDLPAAEALALLDALETLRGNRLVGVA